jgi:outer membrane lipoprotein-sorting protein
MRWSVCLLVVSAAFSLTRAGGPQPNEAEKLFRDLEKKLATAEAVRAAGDMTLKAPGKEAKVEIALTLARGNKSRLKIKGELNGKDVTVETVSDGKDFRAVEGPGGRKGIALHMTEQHNELYGILLTRLGLAGLVEVPPLPKGKKTDLQKMFPVGGFKLGKAEKVNGRDARVIHYHVTLGGKVAIQETLWLDAKTLLPMKRSLQAKGKDDATVAASETYREFRLNPTLDPKTFEIPR